MFSHIISSDITINKLSELHERIIDEREELSALNALAKLGDELDPFKQWGELIGSFKPSTIKEILRIFDIEQGFIERLHDYANIIDPAQGTGERSTSS